jgi:hypothetical protein
MIKQSQRPAFGNRGETNVLSLDEDEVASKRGRYSEFSETEFSGKAPRMAASRFAWAGVMASIAGPAALVLFWSHNEAGPVSATDGRPSASSTLSAAPQVVTQTATMEELRRRGLELLRTEFPEDAPSPPLARADRLELNDPAIRPDLLIATVGEDSVAAQAPFAEPTASSQRAEAKVSKPEKVKENRTVERPMHRRHAGRALPHRRDRVRMANANYVQARREPLMTTVPPEENSAVGSLAPWSSWKNDWDKLWSK